VVTILAVKLPVALAMLSFLPLYGLAFQFLAGLLGLAEFGRAYGLRLRARDVAVYTLGFVPYQVLLTAGAVRAVWREATGRTNWEKTAHTGAHRTPAAGAVGAGSRPGPAPAYAGPRVGAGGPAGAALTRYQLQERSHDGI
jgi:hypothetical protein